MQNNNENAAGQGLQVISIQLNLEHAESMV